MLVWNRDGTSRVGVYFAANACIEQVIQHGEVDVFQAVKNVRRHRPQLVENLVRFFKLKSLKSINLSIWSAHLLPFLSYRPNSSTAMTWFFTTSFTIYIGMAPKSERFTMLTLYTLIAFLSATPLLTLYILYQTRCSIHKPLKSSLHLTFFFLLILDYCKLLFLCIINK